MSCSPILISDDDESFDQVDVDRLKTGSDEETMHLFDHQKSVNSEDTMLLSSDGGSPCLSSDMDSLPDVDLNGSSSKKSKNPDTSGSTIEYEPCTSWNPEPIASTSSTSKANSTNPKNLNVKTSKSAVIRNLFNKQPTTSTNVIKKEPSTSTNSSEPVTKCSTEANKSMVRTIGGVNVRLPVEPYGCQVALMAQVIKAIKTKQNCLLESPTGSGKTLALLCSALAWQQHERDTIAQSKAEELVELHPDLRQFTGAAEYIATPSKQLSPDKLFGKSVFGERSIYDTPGNSSDGVNNKRQEPLHDLTLDEPSCNGEVTIHKRRRLNGSANAIHTTPEKTIDAPLPSTPPNIRVPIIYYGARTHKQIEQVVKEFGRSSYCGEAKMTILSSRDYSCIREFDRNQWASKNDMCRGCITKESSKLETGTDQGNVTRKNGETNCEFYDNRAALRHDQLPPAFDIEDLKATGRELKACPYYAARVMAASAQIVFCPYNYLIEPSIRSALNIELKDNILIIDEAHNIEDICAKAASCTITQEDVQACIVELEIGSKYRYANNDPMNYFDYLLSALKNWDQWFVNQKAWVANKPVNNREAVHVWQVQQFIQTLSNHNIGEQQYPEFHNAADSLCRRLRDNPSSLKGITQATGTLVEDLDTLLGYMFREGGKYKDDFKPAFIRTDTGNDYSNAWRNSEYNKRTVKSSLSLRLVCLNPGIVFAGLKVARCIVLASGTLTPTKSLHSELDTEFPLSVSPNHVIPKERVWVGTLTECPNGQSLRCVNNNTSQPHIQDALGETVHRVCQVTPNGVLCFLSSYSLMDTLKRRWQGTGLWSKLCDIKHVILESRNTEDHNENMEEFYTNVTTSKGALLLAVYRGKVSEGMDFKDSQARAVITVGVPFPNVFDMAVKEKRIYNDKYSETRGLLPSNEWLRVQAYRALNQAVGRCVRHKNDWGAVLLVDSRFTDYHYTEHLSKWVQNFLGTNHHTFQSLFESPAGLRSFMQRMTLQEQEEDSRP